MRGEAGLPRRVTPVGRPRDPPYIHHRVRAFMQTLHPITRQRTRTKWGTTCKGGGEGRGGVRTGAGLVLWRGAGRSGTEGCVFAGCLAQRPRVDNRTARASLFPGIITLFFARARARAAASGSLASLWTSPSPATAAAAGRTVCRTRNRDSRPGRHALPERQPAGPSEKWSLVTPSKVNKRTRHVTVG
jgi:hypothetical protein